jgi:hypothetical protein
VQVVVLRQFQQVAVMEEVAEQMGQMDLVLVEDLEVFMEVVLEEAVALEEQVDVELVELSGLGVHVYFQVR